MLELRQLRLEIGGQPILRNIDLQLEPGKILGMIGESGSGKSMTALATMRLLPRQARLSGEVRLGGESLHALSERKMCQLRGRVLSMIFQEPMTALNPVKPIGAQVAETIQVHQQTGTREALRIAAAALERVGLPPERFPLHRFPHELSGGQRQRVGIAIAIALRPQLLIADEPTTALDVTTQAQIVDLLRRLVREDGMSLIFITHDLGVVAELADTLAIMKDGAVVESGEAVEVLRELKHPYSQMLFASSSHAPERSPLHAPEGTRPLLEVQDVSRTYRVSRKNGLFRQTSEEFRAVDGVSFQVFPGENVGLVGESGCGKSTLTRAILGLEAIQQGCIRIAGEWVQQAGTPPRIAGSRVQVVFQDPYGSFNPRHRVNRLITEPFHSFSEPITEAERKRRVAEALENVGLQAADARKYIHEFSGGQRQRIAIARALITHPELILLDEAVSALDVSIRAQILDLLAELSGRLKLSYLFISHDLSVVRAITDRVLIMQSGQIVEQGPTEQVFRHPTHPYTQTLIASAPDLKRALAQRLNPQGPHEHP
jgi:peptide/nickel transport system ATP-binding protein